MRISPAPRALAAALGLTLGATLGCARGEKSTGEAAGDVGGTVVVATAGDPATLVPPLVVGDQDKQVTDLLFDHLADIGPELNTIGDRGFVPALAERWEWGSDSLSIAFQLNPKARWHDGAPVRADDVRFTYRLHTDPEVGSPVAPNVASIDSVTVRDSLTPVFWFKRRSPTEFFDATYQMSIVPEHLLKDVKPAELKNAAFGRQPVGSGRFRFARWTPGVRLELVADTANYRGRPKLDRLIWSTAPDFTAAVTKLEANEADFFEVLSPANVSDVSKHAELRVLPYPSRQYGFMQFNLRDAKSRRRPHPIFADRELRRALTMALDRRSMVRNVLDTLGYVAIGPVARAISVADTTIPQLPYDTARAARLLDSLGWRDADGDGIRERKGRPLEFSVLTPNSSANRMKMAVLIQEQLRRVGVKVDVEQLEFNAFVDRMNKRAFDAVLGSWVTDPSPGSLRQTWGSAGARSKDGSNFGSYESPTFDAYVDSALMTMDPARAKAYYRQAYSTIIEDAPAVWLYEPRLTAGIHRRIHTPPLRASGWWMSLHEWSIPAAERIERDRIGLRTASR